jgi:FKBP-type peptidyl-prolyl cis-trans isomerase FkpA
MSRYQLALLFSTTAIASCRGQPQPTTNEEKVVYSLGVKLGEGLVPLELSSRELALLEAGLSEAAAMRAAPIDPKTATELSALLARRTAARGAREAARGPVFLHRAAQEPGAMTLESGVVYRELSAGTGAGVSASTRVVKVHLRGTLVDGTEIEDSHELGKPIVLPLGEGLIRCWGDPIARLKVGGKAHVVCPPARAFGDFGRPPLVAPGATVAYDVELVDVAE